MKPQPSTSARALWTGIFLILIATLAAGASNFANYSLVPGVLGVLMASSGILAKRQPQSAPQAALAALVFSVLGVGAGLWGLPDVPKLFSDAQGQASIQGLTLLATLVICGGFVLRWVLDKAR